MDRGSARFVHHKNLAVLKEPAQIADPRNGFACCHAALHQVKRQRSKRRIGHVLGRNRTNTSARE